MSRSKFNGYQGHNDFDFPEDPERLPERDPWENAQGNNNEWPHLPIDGGWGV